MIEFALGLIIILLLAGIAYLLAPKGWRTIVVNIVNAGATALGMLSTELTNFPWTKLLDQQTAYGVILAVLIVNVILRSVTNTKIGQQS